MFITSVGEFLFNPGVSSRSSVFVGPLKGIDDLAEEGEQLLSVGVVIDSSFRHIEDINKFFHDLRSHHVFMAV